MVNAVIDLHAPDGVSSWKKVVDDGIVAVIHKATEGMDFTDAKYATRRVAAQKAGLLWGSYHFGTASDPVKQAEYFLSVVKPGPNDLIALDYETNEPNPKNTMSVKQAEVFVSTVHEATGRWPGLYAGAELRDRLEGKKNAILANCWLWLADWEDQPHVLVGWSDWTLWQYTGGTSGPKPWTVRGIAGPCDREQFNGSETQLRKFFVSS